MFKKIIAMLLTAVTICSFASCSTDKGDDKKKDESEVAFGTEGTKELAASGIVSTTADSITITGDPSAVKIGIILVGDENEGYTKAHMDGIKAAATKLGIPDANIVWKYSITENEKCTEAAEQLIADGCKYIFSNSYGHQDYVSEVAVANKGVNFVSVTGDKAASLNLDNFSNAFTNVYESRYVSGVVAGLKLKALVDDGTLTKAAYPSSFDTNGNIKIGYVGAYPYAEVVSGYTAFYLGIKSIVSNVVMDVRYTSSWFNETAEQTAAQAFIADGCVIIGQHADSQGAPKAVQTAKEAGKLCFSVGYNVSMLDVAADVALTSATNNWEVYYEYAFATAVNGGKIATNWTAGYSQNAVSITALGTACAEGTQAKVDEVIAAIKAGTLKIFDTSKFTVGGKAVTWAYATDTNGNFTNDKNNVIADGYFHESFVQSAPAFFLRIDGISEHN